MKIFIRALEYPKIIIALLFVLFLLAGGVLQRLSMDFSAELMLESDIEGKAEFEDFLAAFGRDDNLVIIGIDLGDGGPQADELERLERITKSILAMDEIEDAVSLAGAGGENFYKPLVNAGADPAAVIDRARRIPAFRGSLVSEDGSALAVLARIKKEYNNFDARVILLANIDKLLSGEKGPEYHVGGIPVFRNKLAGLLRTNLTKFFPIVTLIMGVLLFAVFRTGRGVMLPFLAVFIANAWNLAFLTITGGKINMLSSVLPTLVAVIGISDSVHLIAYYNELRVTGRDKKTALVEAIRNVGAACALTSFTTMIGFISLLFVKMNVMREFGVYAATGILFAFFATMLLVPAGLNALKPRENPYPGALGIDGGPVIGHINAIVQKFPAYVLLAGAAMMVAAFFGMTRLVVDTKLLEDVRSNNPISTTVHFLQDRLSGVLAVEVVIDAAPGVSFNDPVAITRIAALEDRVEEIDHVISVVSAPDLISGIPAFFTGMEKAPVMSRSEAAARVKEFSALMKSAPRSALSGFVSDDWKKIRVSVRITDFGTKGFPEFNEQLTDALEETVGGLGAYTVTGTARFAGEILSGMLDDIRMGFLFALAVIFVVMSVHFRSLRLGILSTIPNLMPIILTLGFMGLTGVTLRTSTSVTFVIAFGIAVDDTIHFLTHYRRARRQGAPPRGAVEDSLRTAGPAIIFTSVIMILGFSALLFSDFTSTAHFGLLTMHIMFAALIGDLFILPALLIIFDRKR